MNSNPLVTIGITSYNAQDSISCAIDCALKQDWDNFEIITVDDCSDDGTWQIVKKIQEEYPDKIKVFQNDKNSGVAVSRNKIIKEAKGEFIAFFDDDDISVPTRLRVQLERIIEYERLLGKEDNLVICHAARMQKYPNGEEVYIPTMGMSVDTYAPHGIDVAKYILTGKPSRGAYGACATCSQMARKRVYNAVGGFDNKCRRGQDMELNIRLAQAGAHFVGIGKPLVHQTLTYTDDKKIDKLKNARLYIINKHKSFIEKHGSYDFCLKWSLIKFCYIEDGFIKFVLNILKLFAQHPILMIKRVIWLLPNFFKPKTQNYKK